MIRWSVAELPRDPQVGSRPLLDEAVLTHSNGVKRIHFAKDYPTHWLRRNPEFRRIYRGAYVAADAAPQEIAYARIFAVAHLLKAPFALSHVSAAAVHGFTESHRSDLVHMYQEYRGGKDVADVVVRHRTTVEYETQMIEGVPVTDPIRTVIDCARFLPISRALVIADSALRTLAKMDRFDRQGTIKRYGEIQEEIADCFEKMLGQRNIRRARAVIECATPFADSPPESILRYLTMMAGLPTPQVQPMLQVEGHTYFPDLYWETANGPVVAEFDGKVKYEANFGADPSTVVFEEKQREDAMRRAGITVVRFVYSDLSLSSHPARQLMKLVPKAQKPHELIRYSRK